MAIPGGNPKVRVTPTMTFTFFPRMSDFRFRKMGETVKRDRFISAPSKESAEEQFNYIMKKDGVEVEILEIKEIEE